MESLSSDAVYKIDMFKSLPDVVLEKCAFLSVRPDTVKNLVQAMQGENIHADKQKLKIMTIIIIFFLIIKCAVCHFTVCLVFFFEVISTLKQGFYDLLFTGVL